MLSYKYIVCCWYFFLPPCGFIVPLFSPPPRPPFHSIIRHFFSLFCPPFPHPSSPLCFLFSLLPPPPPPTAFSHLPVICDPSWPSLLHPIASSTSLSHSIFSPPLPRSSLPIFFPPPPFPVALKCEMRVQWVDFESGGDESKWSVTGEWS